MKQTAFWSNLGRSAVIGAAASTLVLLGGCSSGASRFDFPAFSLTGNDSAAAAPQYASDPATTASLPVPPEPVYGGSGGGYKSYASAGSYGGNSYGNGGGQSSYGGGSYGGGNASYGSSSGGGYNTASYGSGSGSSYSGSSSGSGYAGASRSGASESYARPTPVSYTPQSSDYGSQRSSASPMQSAVYTPPMREEPKRIEPRRTQVAAADRAELIGPGSKTITVQSGDSLYLYSLRYKVSVEAIQKANNLDGISLTAGQKIIIPAAGSTVEDNSYIVQAGDSLNSIARSQGVSEQSLAQLNGITNMRSLQIGQELKIPGKAAAATTMADSTPSRPAPAASEDNTVRSVRTTRIEAPTGAGEDAPRASAKSDTPPAAASGNAGGSQIASLKTLPEPDAMSGQRFRWPVNGRIVAKFGARADGGHNDGIDLAVPQGTSVKAAENGVVAYAGNELKGYGNLVLIRHADNWVTAYAHNEDLMVKRGDKVSRGQIIAKAGATGSVSQPQLHFELRKGSRPVDPLQYMTSATASAE